MRTDPVGGAGATRRQHPLLELTRARLLEFVREPSAIFWTFGFPVVLAVVLGVAFRERPEQVFRAAVESDAPGAAGTLDLLAGKPGVEASLRTPEEAARALRAGEIDVVVRSGGAGGGFAYVYDPALSDGRAARMAVDDALQRALGRADAAEVREERVTEPGARYVDFLVPGLIGLNLLGSALWGLGYSVVEARSRKLLKRFAATPMRRAHYLLSFVFSRLLFLAAEVAALVGFGFFVFAVPVRGSIVSLALVSLVGALSFAGIALLIASRPRSTEIAAGWMNFAMLPMWLLSGSFFPYARFPEAVQPAIRALPLTALNDALRAVMSDGASIVTTWPQLLVLAAWGVVGFLVALRIFRWQ